MVQACDLANGVELEFTNRRLRLRPYEISTREERHKFSYARAKISSEAAQLIIDYQAYNEPVTVKIGGAHYHRYYVPEDGLIYEDEQEQAWVELLDPLRVLEDEVITSAYDSISLQDIVEDIFSRRNDPNGLITDYEIVNKDIADQYSRSLRGRLQQGSLRGNFDEVTIERDGFNPLRRIQESLTRFGAWFDKSEIEEGGFFFDEDTLYDALLAVENEFGVMAWVDYEGTLCIGVPELRTDNAIEIYGDPDLDPVSISAYNVGTSRNSLRKLEAISTPFSYLNGLVHPHTQDQNALRFVAEVETPGAEGRVGSLDEPVRVSSQEELETVVYRKFVDAYMSHNGGTMEFNGLASTDQDSLAQFNVGDLIGVTPSINRLCDRPIEGGAFIANRVHHKVNPRVGWQITVAVNRLVPDADVTSYIFDPTTGEEFDELEDVE